MDLRRIVSNSGLSLRSIAMLGLIPFTLCTPIIAQRGGHFDCSRAKPAAGELQLSAGSLYNAASLDNAAAPEFGFDLDTVPSSFTGGSCSSAQPFFFSIAATDGNYQVTLVLGGPSESTTTVRAESRRLFVTSWKSRLEVPTAWCST